MAQGNRYIDLLMVFHQLDVDGKGYVTIQDFCNHFCANSEEIQEILKVCKIEEGETIDFDAFKTRFYDEHLVQTDYQQLEDELQQLRLLRRQTTNENLDEELRQLRITNQELEQELNQLRKGPKITNQVASSNLEEQFIGRGSDSSDEAFAKPESPFVQRIRQRRLLSSSGAAAEESLSFVGRTDQDFETILRNISLFFQIFRSALSVFVTIFWPFQWLKSWTVTNFLMKKRLKLVVRPRTSTEMTSVICKTKSTD